MTIGATEDPAGKEEPFSIAARGTAIAPHLGRVQGRDGIDQIGQGRPERVFMEVPVGDALDGGIGNVIGEAGERLAAEITAICGLSYIVGSWPLLVIVEREISYAVHAHHGGEDTYYSPMTAASAGTPSVWTAWLWPAVSSRLPRHGGGTPGVTSSHAPP